MNTVKVILFVIAAVMALFGVLGIVAVEVAVLGWMGFVALAWATTA